ncbi:hypothetical protein [Sporolactobacillus pectinivorans]|uniref:hypothetical protein n=1 Tax=Sporolactobacillus pectinivorans TaxID=1591408 RepID=UPI000C269E71|nr:hypothetical protein [Sporolactobacillus pectinivorans]
MTAWIALLKKELRLGSLAFIVFLAFQLLIMALGIFLAIRFEQGLTNKWSLITAFGALLLLCHILYLVSYMLVNVFSERKTFHLWMHNPLPAWSMLAAKLLSGLIYMTVSLLIAAIYAWIGFLIYSRYTSIPKSVHVYRYATFISAQMYWIAIFSGIVFIFLWLVLRYFQSRVGKWSWLVMIIGISAVIYALVKLTQLGVLTFLTHWGRIPESFMRYWISTSGISRTGGVSVDYIGNYVAGLLVMLILYTLSSWLMDHKLEAS